MRGVALLVLVCLVALPNLATADDSPSRRPRLLDGTRVKQLADILRSDPDEKRQKAAVKELADADPRVHPEVMPSLIAALRKDAASVRASAAEAIGRFRTVFPLAGDALERAAESDPSPAVRSAAKQSLWEYHLNGYQSAKGKEAYLTQTAEPPIAKPTGPRAPLVGEPTIAPALPVARATPLPPPAALPPTVSPPGPRIAPAPTWTDARSLVTRVPYGNLTGEPPLASSHLTGEPPLAQSKNPPARTPQLTSEPPILPRWPEPVVIGHSPSFTLELPPIVTPPDGK